MWNLTFSMFIMFSMNSMVYTWVKIRFFPVSTLFAYFDASLAIIFALINLWIMFIMYKVCKDRCAQLSKSIILENSNITAKTKKLKNLKKLKKIIPLSNNDNK